jgi:hypothetical protein
MQPARLAGRDEPLGALQVHHVDVVVAHVLLERGGQLRALGVLHRDEVLDAHRVEHLAAEALGRDAGADALARGVDRRRGAGRAAADDEHVEGLLGAIFSPRAAAPVSSLARICSTSSALANISPFRNTVGTAITCAPRPRPGTARRRWRRGGCAG